jgi:hypothetical protein
MVTNTTVITAMAKTTIACRGMVNIDFGIGCSN